MNELAIPQPPRVPDANRRIAIFRAFVVTLEASAKAQAENRLDVARRLQREAQRLLTASRS